MNSRILKLIVGGALLGAAIFFIPFFLLKVAAVILIFGLFRWMFKGRGRSGRWAGFADRIRSMSDEEYANFKAGGHGPCGRSRNKLATESVQS